MNIKVSVEMILGPYQLTISRNHADGSGEFSLGHPGVPVLNHVLHVPKKDMDAFIQTLAEPE